MPNTLKTARREIFEWRALCGDLMADVEEERDGKQKERKIMVNEERNIHQKDRRSAATVRVCSQRKVD